MCASICLGPTCVLLCLSCLFGYVHVAVNALWPRRRARSSSRFGCARVVRRGEGEGFAARAMYNEASVSSDEDVDDDNAESVGLLRSPGGAPARAEKQLTYGNGGRPTLSLISVATITYFSVSGGQFGLEIAVAAAGPAAVIALLVILSVVWSMPCALMTAELSSALPSRAGYMHWVTRGLGPLAGGLNGWISLLGSAVDSSTYPAIFCDYAMFAIQASSCGLELASGPTLPRPLRPSPSRPLPSHSYLQHWSGQPLGARERYVMSSALTLMMLLLNLRGITLAARASIALAIFSLLPFVVMSLLLFVKAPASALTAVRAALGAGVPQPNLPLLLSLTLWSTSGFDAVSLVSSEVRGRARTASGQKTGGARLDDMGA